MKTDKSGAAVGITFEHHQVHEGNMFILPDEATGVMIATPKRWLIVPGASALKGIHLRLGVSGTNGLKVELFEGTTTSNDGVAVAMPAANRVEPKTIDAVLTKDPTVTGDGTLIGTGRAGGGNFIQPGGQADHEVEYILKPSTKYQIKVTVTVDTTTVTLSGRAYQAR